MESGYTDRYRSDPPVDPVGSRRKGGMKVEAVVARTFHLDSSEVTDDSSRETLEAWDSMGHVSLITSLEDEFRVSLAISDAMEMTSVRDIKRILKDYGVVL